MSNLYKDGFVHELGSPITHARDMQPWLKEQAARIEDSNCIPQDVADRLIEAGLFRMSVPRRFGGYEMCPSDICKAVFEVARGCASSAWMVGLVAANLMMVGKFSDQAQEEVFGGEQAAIVPMLTGGVGYDMDITYTDGGIRLSGKWRYASGIDIASWVGILLTLPATDELPERQALVLVSQKEFSIDHDSWQVLGMRGTGSKNVSLQDIFVPEHRFMDWKTIQDGGRHDTCTNDGAIYRYPLNSAFAMSVGAPTLGIAKAVSEAYSETVKTRIASGTGQAAIDDKMSHISVASSAAIMNMLCDGLAYRAKEVTAKVKAGQTISREERAMFRVSLATSTSIALKETQKIFRSIGGSVLPKGSQMERLFRDVHAMSSHFLLQEEAIGEIAGRLILDLDVPASARI